MKKSDLRSGMLIENRRGQLGLILLQTTRGDIIASNVSNPNYPEDTTWSDLSSFSDDLSHSYSSESDIVKVYSKLPNCEALLLIKGGRELLWERESFLEVTLQQVAEKFGVKLEEIRIKK